MTISSEKHQLQQHTSNVKFKCTTINTLREIISATYASNISYARTPGPNSTHPAYQTLFLQLKTEIEEAVVNPTSGATPLLPLLEF